MPRPIVEVLQTVQTVQTTVTEPTQATLIVGPNYKLIRYKSDNTAAANAPAKLEDKFDPYGYGATVWPSGDVDVALDDRGTLDESSIKVYLEDVKYEVGAPASQKISSPYGDATTTLAELAANVDSWQYLIQHEDGSFKDATVRDLRDGDIVKLQYPFANVFVPDSEFTDAIFANLIDSTKPITLSIASASVTDEPVFRFTDGNTRSTSKSQVDLFDAGNSIFSTIANGALAITEGTVAILKVDGTAVTGTLSIPSGSTLSSTLLLEGSAADRSTIKIADRVRQYVAPHLTDALQHISGRIEAPLTGDFPNNESIYLPNADGDWTYSASTQDLTFGNALTLSDTDLPNASGLTDKAITEATIYVASRGLNISNTTSAISISSLNLESELGIISSDNPLALAASIALQNSGTSTIRVLRTAEDSSTGFLNALPFINANPNVYSILPLTQDISVLNSYAQAAVTQSTPGIGKFRIVLGSAESAPSWRYWAGNRSSEYGRTAANLSSGTITNAAKAADVAGTATIVDPQASFLSTEGPSVGDTVIFNYSDAQGAPVLTSSFTCVVKSIQSNSQLTVDLPVAEVVVENTNTDIFFTGAKDIKDKRDLQVEDLLKSIASLSSNIDLAKRLVMVYPGEVSVGDESGLPGYYLTAAVGGMLSAFEPHRPKNNISLSGIADIEYSNLGYFTDLQIDQLSDGGYFVLIQEVPGGLPFCVHQVTVAYRNSAATQEFSELSVVNNFDYVSSVFKRNLEPYVGVWNVIPQAYSSIMSTLDASILNLRSQSVNRIGPPLLTGEVISVEPSAADAGTVNVLMDVQLPKVLNKIRLEIISQ